MGPPLRIMTMGYDPDIHHRRSIRLRGYDYSSAGAYFITICIQGRTCLFGDIADGVLQPNDAGRMVAEWWLKLPGKFPGITLDECVVMPNHFHGIVNIVGAPPCGSPPLYSTPKSGRPHGAAPTVGDVMDWFKTMTTNAYIKGVNHAGWPPFAGRLWQRNFFERVLRNDSELNGIREYIRSNPVNWANDDEYVP